MKPQSNSKNIFQLPAARLLKKLEGNILDIHNLQLEMMQFVKNIHLSTHEMNSRFAILEEKILKLEKIGMGNDSYENVVKEEQNVESYEKEDKIGDKVNNTFSTKNSIEGNRLTIADINTPDDLNVLDKLPEIQKNDTSISHEESESTSVDSKETNLVNNSDHLTGNKISSSIRNLTNLFKKDKQNVEDGKENKNALLDSEGIEIITNSDMRSQTNLFKKEEQNVESDKKEEKICEMVKKTFYTKNAREKRLTLADIDASDDLNIFHKLPEIRESAISLGETLDHGILDRTESALSDLTFQSSKNLPNFKEVKGKRCEEDELSKPTRRSSFLLGQNKHELSMLDPCKEDELSQPSKGVNSLASGIILGQNRYELDLLRHKSSDKLPLVSSKDFISSDSRKSLSNILSKWKIVSQHQVFSEFCILSLHPKTLSESKCISTIGSNFLDPFCFNSINVIEEYSFSTNHGISNDTFSSFCFPKGIKVRLIPRCGLENAKKLGWVGEGGDTYQILVFTNELGQKCHGLSITTREELEVPNMKKIMLMREQRKAVRVLSQYWLKYRQNLISRRRKLLSDSKNSIDIPNSPYKNLLKNSFRGLKRSGSFLHSFMSNNDEGLIHELVVEDINPECKEPSHSYDVFQMDEFQKMDIIHELVVEDNNPEYTKPSPQVTPSQMSSYDIYQMDIFQKMESEIEKKSLIRKGMAKEKSVTCSTQISFENDVLYKGRRQTVESYETMLENELIGEVCIVEKCYILTGVDDKSYSLLFHALQQLIDLERKGEDTCPRRVMLHRFKEELYLSTSQSQIDYPKNELEHLTHKKIFFQSHFPFLENPQMIIPLPLPQVISEWGVAILILRFKMSNLIKILKMLMLERSVLIIGNKPVEVSVCTCALLELLKPYKWASVFIPVLPGDTLDFVDSPVPFITGAIDEDNKIFFDSRVRQAMMSGLSVMNLITGEIYFTKEPGIQNTLSQSDTIIRTLIDYEKLESYQERLNYLAQEKTSCLKSFRLFFQHGASSKESLTLKSFRRVMFHYVSNISAGISHSWEKYCELATQTNQCQFFPDLFIEPLQYQLEFRKLMAHTQLFVSHIEEKHNKSSAIRSATRGVNALIIANWVYKKWKNYTFSKS